MSHKAPFNRVCLVERRLRARLLWRTRHVNTTLDGEANYQRCRTILADIEDAEAAFAGFKSKGLLRMDVYGRHRCRMQGDMIPKARSLQSTVSSRKTSRPGSARIRSCRRSIQSLRSAAGAADV